MKTKDQKEKFIQLRAEGNSFDKISDILNISKPTLINWNIDFSKEIDIILIRKELSSEIFRETNNNKYYTGFFENEDTSGFSWGDEIEKTLKLN